MRRACAVLTRCASLRVLRTAARVAPLIHSSHASLVCETRRLRRAVAWRACVGCQSAHCGAAVRSRCGVSVVRVDRPLFRRCRGPHPHPKGSTHTHREGLPPHSPHRDLASADRPRGADRPKDLGLHRSARTACAPLQWPSLGSRPGRGQKPECQRPPKYMEKNTFAENLQEVRASAELHPKEKNPCRDLHHPLRCRTENRKHHWVQIHLPLSPRPFPFNMKRKLEWCFRGNDAVGVRHHRKRKALHRMMQRSCNRHANCQLFVAPVTAKAPLTPYTGGDSSTFSHEQANH